MMATLVSAEDLRVLGAILFVAAHPDDETFTAGGILAAAVRNGQRVACVTATRGEAGVQDESRWPREKLAEIRTDELEASLAVLGVKDHTWLDYRDGECSAADEAGACEQLRSVVERFAPDTILTFGPDGLTGHPDHQAVSRWTQVVVQGSEIRVLWAVMESAQHEQLKAADKVGNIFFLTEKPPVVAGKDCAVDLKLDPGLADLKRRALEAVPSQMEKILGARPLDRPGEALAWECFVDAKKGGKGE